MNIKKYNLRNLSSIIDTIDTDTPFAFGADGDQISIDPVAYLIVEEIFNLIEERREILSIKLFKNLDDKLAYEWHTDDSTPGEEEIKFTALLYLKGCEGSKIEIKTEVEEIITAEPYMLVFVPKEVQHRAHGDMHKNFLKFTFK